MFLLLFITVVIAQEYVPPKECPDLSPRSCIDKCSCIYCTLNETISEMLLNGTMNPKRLRLSGDNGTCTNSKCPKDYYTVPSEDAIIANGRSCNVKKRFIIMVSVFLTMLSLILCIMVSLILYYRWYIPHLKDEGVDCGYERL